MDICSKFSASSAGGSATLRTIAAVAALFPLTSALAEEKQADAAAARSVSLAGVENPTGVVGKADDRDDARTGDTQRHPAVLEEVVVTGTRLNISEQESPVPLVRFDRVAIEESGVSNVGELLDRLPQQPYSLSEGNSVGATKTTELRGIGPGTTLVLINGRRTVSSALNGVDGGFDLTTIPIFGVDRVEILPESASGIYGTDAVGGVINIILKKEIDHPAVEGYVGTADGGGTERRISVAGGHATERLKVTAMFDFFTRGVLSGADRDLYSNNDFRRFGGVDWRDNASSPGNVCSADGNNLPGLNAACAAVPVSAAGTVLKPADFLATAGQTNLTSDQKYQPVVPGAQRLTALSTAEFALTDKTTAFGELLFSKRDSTLYFVPPGVYDQLVPASNPFNPFGVPVLATYSFTELGPGRSSIDSKAFRGVAGVRGRLGSWDWEVSALGIGETAHTVDGPALNMDNVNAALAATDPAKALNLFQTVPGESPELLTALVGPPYAQRIASTAWQADAFLRGPLFDLPGGSVEAAIGSEARKEKLTFPLSYGVADSAVGRRTVAAAYAEMKVPLIGSAMHVPAMDQLTATVAGRLDHYGDFGSTFNPQAGLAWRPVHFVLVRGSYGRSFRAPGLYQLFEPRTTTVSLVVDPLRNNELNSVQYTSGGNPHLEPEKSSTWSAGLELSFPDDHALQLSADYWAIRQDQRATQLSFQTIFANLSLFPDRIVRAPPTPADVAAGLPGRIVSVDASIVNAGRLSTSGIDLRLSSTLQTGAGTFTPNLLGTWTRAFDTADFPISPVIQRVGIADYTGTIPRWHLAANLPWRKAPWGAAVSARYVSRVQDSIAFTSAPSGRDVASQTLVDVQLSFELGHNPDRLPWLADTTFRVGAINLFNRLPSFSQSYGYLGYDPTQGDARGRFGYASISKSF